MMLSRLQGLTDSRWVYASAIYPLLILIPYFSSSERYGSVSRFLYVGACALLAVLLIFLLQSPRVKRFREWSEPRAFELLVLLAGLYALVMFYLAYGIRLRNGMGVVIDVANMEQVLWATSQGRLFYSSFNNGSYLGGHFAIIFLPLSVVYGIFRDIGSIFAIQSFLLAAASIPLFWLIKNALGNLRALLVALAFLASPAVVSQHFTLYLNHFAPFFWLGASLAFWRQLFWLFGGFGLLAASVQEDIAFSLLIFALLSFLERRSARWKIFSLVFPLAWFGTAMLVIQSTASATGRALGGNFGDLGTTPIEMIQTLLARPSLVFDKFVMNSPDKMRWVYELTAPFIFILPFQSPMVLAALPDWFVFALSSSINSKPDVYSLSWYYSLFITTVLFAALGYALNRLSQSALDEGLRRNFLNIVGAVVVCSNLAFLPLVISPDMFKTDGGLRAGTLRKIHAMIPPDACVITTYDISQPFAKRYPLYGEGSTYDPTINCKYVVLSQRLINSNRNDVALVTIAARVQRDPNFELILNENQILFYARR